MIRCAAPIVEAVYNGSDNVIRLSLSNEDGDRLASLAALTRVVVSIGATDIDSDVVGSSVIWWTDTAVDRGETVGVLKLRLGGQGLTPGTYDDVVITIYDSTHVNGLRYRPALKLTVYEAP